ncbi:hypothetical protein [Nocardia uniformis]|nr:hypothetical protein [Nocardia uniformis]
MSDMNRWPATSFNDLCGRCGLPIVAADSLTVLAGSRNGQDDE